MNKTLVLGLTLVSLSAHAGPPGWMDAEARAIVRANREARTIEEWSRSGNTPSDFFKWVLKTPMTDTLAPCRALRNLSDEELALFDGELREEANQVIVAGCPDLIQRLDEFWTRGKLELAKAEDARSRTETESGPMTVEIRTVDMDRIGEIASGGLKAGEIALTFDDGPSVAVTPVVLEALAQAGIRANFFQTGKNASKHPDLSRRVAETDADGDGEPDHVVGSHTQTHANLRDLGVGAAALDEIRQGRENVARASGTEVPFFRFPYGARTPKLREALAKEGLVSFMWNIDSTDWQIPNPAKLLAHALAEVDRKKGGVILFHDTHRQTGIILPEFIRGLRKRGFKTIVFLPLAKAPASTTP